SSELADALGKLIRDPALRKKMGAAGRERIENNFSIQKTIEPLEKQFRSRLATEPNESTASTEKQKQVAYLVDRWPDEALPLLTDELRALQRTGVPHVLFVLQPPIESELRGKTNDLVMNFEFLPDPMVTEAEWQTNRPLVNELESIWANH